MIDDEVLVDSQVISLNKFRSGDVGRVVKIVSVHNGRLLKLSAMGIVPGSILRCQQRSPAYVIWVGETQLSLDEAVAQDIWLVKI
jgi:DtxR family Mn-dependent transcriptional regulator